jgi:hypothetical protein
MPVLPLIDLMILIAWTSLIVAGAQKLIGVALQADVPIVGLNPSDFVVVAGVSLLFALSLAARVWVRAHESVLQRVRRDTGFGAGEILPDFPDPREGLDLAPEGEPRDSTARAIGPVGR